MKEKFLKRLLSGFVWFTLLLFLVTFNYETATQPAREVGFVLEVRNLSKSFSLTTTNFELALATFLPCKQKKKQTKCFSGSDVEGESSANSKHLEMWEEHLKQLIEFSSYSNDQDEILVSSIHVVVASDCSTEIEFLKQHLSSDLNVSFYVVENGDEMRSLHLLPNRDDYFISTDVDYDVSNFRTFIRKEISHQRYPWFDFTLAASERRQFSKMMFVHPGHFLPTTKNTIDNLKFLMKSKPIAIEEEKNIFSNLESLEKFIKQEKLKLEIWNEEEEATFEGKLTPGRMSFKNPFSKLNFINYFWYELWYWKSGYSMELLTSYRSLTSPSVDFLRNLKPVSFFYINLDVFDTHKNLILDDAVKEKFSGNKCVSGLYRGFIDPLIAVFPNDFKHRFKIVHSRRISFNSFDLLHNVDKCINRRQFTWALNKVRKAGTLVKEEKITEPEKFTKKYNFYYRTHKMSKRVIATTKAWSHQLRSVGIPFHVVLMDTEETNHEAFTSETSGMAENTGVTLINQTEAGLMMPMEALNIYQLAADVLDSNKYFTFAEKIGNVYYANVDMTSAHSSWLFTQITLSPIFAEIMLNPSFDDNEDNQFFWFVDYDVAFTGEISKLIELTDHIDADLMGGRLNEPVEKWFWREPSGKGIEYYLNHSDDICMSEVDDFRGMTTTGAIRLSKRMIRWVLESMFIPEKLLWIVDEAFYASLCNFHEAEGCSYYPFNAINVGHHSQLSTHEINRWLLSIKVYKKHLEQKKTRFQLWHPVKHPDVFPSEQWLN